MQLKQDFLINRPADEVWSFFHDIPALAACLPGAAAHAEVADRLAPVLRGLL